MGQDVGESGYSYRSTPAFQRGVDEARRVRDRAIADLPEKIEWLKENPRGVEKEFHEAMMERLEASKARDEEGDEDE